MLVRLSALKTVGNFDERYFLYYEEAEWCAKVRKSGFRYCRRAAVCGISRRGARNWGHV